MSKMRAAPPSSPVVGAEPLSSPAAGAAVVARGGHRTAVVACGGRRTTVVARSGRRTAVVARGEHNAAVIARGKAARALRRRGRRQHAHTQAQAQQCRDPTLFHIRSPLLFRPPASFPGKGGPSRENGPRPISGERPARAHSAALCRHIFCHKPVYHKAKNFSITHFEGQTGHAQPAAPAPKRVCAGIKFEKNHAFSPFFRAGARVRREHM